MVPLVTPFTPTFGIDWPAFDAHVARLLASGIEVLIPADLVGEAWALERTEKVMLFERAVRLAGGRAAVVAKISEPGLPGASLLADAARSAGVDAVKVAVPTVSADDVAVEEYVRAAGLGAGLPFMLETSGGDSPVQVLDRLVEDPGLVGLEETSLDLDRFDALVQRYGTRMPIIAGSEDVLGFTLLLGAAGFMTATPNFAPAFMHALWAAGAAADARKTLGLYRRLRRYRRLFEAELRAGRPMFVSYTKAALELLGCPVGPPRPPLRRLTLAETHVLRATLQETLGLELAGAPRGREGPIETPGRGAK